jgi:prevent-host-death family protein
VTRAKSSNYVYPDPYKRRPLFLPYKTGCRVLLTNLLSPVVSRVKGVFSLMRIPDKTEASSLEQISRVLHGTNAGSSKREYRSELPPQSTGHCKDAACGLSWRGKDTVKGIGQCDMEKRSTPRVVSALTARTQLTQIMRRAKKGRERFVVDRRGEPQVVIMGIEDFLANVAPEPRVLAAIRAASKESGTDKITMCEIDQEIAAYRNTEKGRSFAK